MSNAEKPEFQALRELEEVADRVAEELNAFRRRALQAEADRARLDEAPDLLAARDQMARLERENRELQQRVEYARERVSELLSRLEFLEEQIASDSVRG